MDTPPPPIHPENLLACPRCVVCKYDLVGLPDWGHCPECNTPISISLRRGLLCESDHAYIQRLARGAAWSFFSSLAIAATALLILFYPQTTSGLLRFILFAGNLSAWAWGLWLLTTVDPDRPREAQPVLPGQLVRIGAAAIWGLSGVSLIALPLVALGAPTAAVAVAFISLSWLCVALFLLATILVYIHRLGSRLRDQSISGWATVMSVFAVPGAFFFLAAVIMMGPDGIVCAGLSVLCIPVCFTMLIGLVWRAIRSDLFIARTLANQHPTITPPAKPGD